MQNMSIFKSNFLVAYSGMGLFKACMFATNDVHLESCNEHTVNGTAWKQWIFIDGWLRELKPGRGRRVGRFSIKGPKAVLSGGCTAGTGQGTWGDTLDVSSAERPHREPCAM